jgi:predicted RNA binding protein YcfA (HicA-like mRNA interferase family)
MVRTHKLLEAILAGKSDSGIDFVALCQLLIRLGFTRRIKGGHHIFTHTGMSEIINLQPKGSKAKAYQVKQIRNILKRYRLGATDVNQI